MCEEEGKGRRKEGKGREKEGKGEGREEKNVGVQTDTRPELPRFGDVAGDGPVAKSGEH